MLRNIAGEYMLMPAGENIGKFRGSVLMNELSAFVWEKLQLPMTREELLAEVLAEYDVDETTAAMDIDALLKDFAQMNLIEE